MSTAIDAIVYTVCPEIAACPGSLFTMNEKEIIHCRETKGSDPRGNQQLPPTMPRTTHQANLPRAIEMSRGRFSVLIWITFLSTETSKETYLTLPRRISADAELTNIRTLYAKHFLTT
ncbi:unnamed protein product [Sphacelaria rigidula]